MIKLTSILVLMLIFYNAFSQSESLAEINRFECTFSCDTFPEDLKIEIFEEPENVFWCVANLNLRNVPKYEKDFLWFITDFRNTSFNDDILMSKSYSSYKSDMEILIINENIQIHDLDSLKTYKAHFMNEYGEIIAKGYCYSEAEISQK